MNATRNHMKFAAKVVAVLAVSTVAFVTMPFWAAALVNLAVSWCAFD